MTGILCDTLRALCDTLRSLTKLIEQVVCKNQTRRGLFIHSFDLHPWLCNAKDRKGCAKDRKERDNSKTEL